MHHLALNGRPGHHRMGSAGADFDIKVLAERPYLFPELGICHSASLAISQLRAMDNLTVLQRRPFSKGPIVAIVDFSHCDT